MADDSYEVIDANDTVVTSGTLAARDAFEVIVQTRTSGVAFPIVFNVASNVKNDPELLAGAIDGIARPYSGYINDALARPEVVGVYSLQDQTPSLTVANLWVVTVASSTGNLTKQLTIAYTDLIPDRLGPIVDQAVAGLDQLETLGS